MGERAVLRSRYASDDLNDVLVLCYHAVSPAWDSPLSVTPDTLERQLRLLARRGYTSATFADVLDGRTSGRTVVVTFDDAYRSVIELAGPILDDLGWVATVFAPSGFIGTEAPMSWPGIEEWLTSPQRDELIPMGWDELRELTGRGWEIGSHTVTHPRLSRAQDGDLEHELTASRAAIEEALGAPCRTIAYPYGDQDARVRAAAAAAGYTGAAALDRSLTPGDRMAWPRVGLYQPDTGLRFALKASRTVRRFRERLRATDYSRT